MVALSFVNPPADERPNASPTRDMLPSLPSSWREVLSPAIHDPGYRALENFLDLEARAGAQVLPPREQIFAAFEFCAPEAVRVVLLGQDPYPTPGDAHGLCFSVQKGRPMPRSLRNVWKELKEDLGLDMPAHGNLEHWARQGILLLNTVLTVRAGEANSHRGRGWEGFTDSVITHLSGRERPIVFLLWGNAAQTKRDLINQARHPVVACAHPSPLSARKFFGSRCFSRVNHHLVALGGTAINW
ncbi:MAG: uracil-DNA glycosylase [Opitutaceae bacterium]|nr:uracil-DNA glycosylase [Opitutaceae bacterium]